MSKILFVKPDAIPEEFVGKFGVEDCYLKSDCAPVDIDELEEDYRLYLARLIERGHKLAQPFSEYLQERMK